MSQAKLEKTMDDYFVKKAPFQIPAGGKKFLVDWAPVLAIIGGVLSLIGAWGLWQASRVLDNDIIQLANDYARSIGAETIRETDVFYYGAIVFLVAQALLLFAAYKGLKARTKNNGWSLLLLSTLLSFGYGIFVFVSDYGSFGNLLSSVIGIVISLYILAQIRSSYK